MPSTTDFRCCYRDQPFETESATTKGEAHTIHEECYVSKNGRPEPPLSET